MCAKTAGQALGLDPPVVACPLGKPPDAIARMERGLAEGKTPAGERAFTRFFFGAKRAILWAGGHHFMNEEKTAQGLGWFSITLGLAELVAPRQVGESIGVEGHDRLIQAMGVRELVAGLGLLNGRDPTPWLWARVAGDMMDFGLLAAALRSPRSNQARVTGAMMAVAGVTALDVLTGIQHHREAVRSPSHPRLTGRGVRPHGRTPLMTAITINRPVEEVFSFWRNFENLPRFMNHLESVTVLNDHRSRWVAKGPGGTEVSWEAEIIEEKPNELIAWESLEGSAVENAGSVRFERATGGRGTVVRVKLQYRPPGGAIGATVAKLLGEAPEKQIPQDLLRVKQLLETGEIAQTEGQPAGRARSTSLHDEWLRS